MGSCPQQPGIPGTPSGRLLSAQALQDNKRPALRPCWTWGPSPTDDQPTISQLPSVSCQTQPVGTEPASSWAPPSALPGATPHSPVATGPITETKMDAWGFSVAHG